MYFFYKRVLVDYLGGRIDLSVKEGSNLNELSNFVVCIGLHELPREPIFFKIPFVYLRNVDGEVSAYFRHYPRVRLFLC